MKVLLSIFGLIYNDYGSKGQKDIRHCWANIHNKLVKPLKDLGHDVKINIITQSTDSSDVELEIIQSIMPTTFIKVYDNFHGGYTTKLKAVEVLQGSDQDFNIITRSDIHFTDKHIVEMLDFKKFNFLFPERGWWEHTKFTTDNFYAWNDSYSKYVLAAMKETKHDHYTSTHNMYNRLLKYMSISDLHFISNNEELSDINSFYTLCRKLHHANHADISLMHKDVEDLHYKNC